ncbi:MAG: hypothetical protein ABI689_17975, partial [Thermoanaerobaculia bacterium]
MSVAFSDGAPIAALPHGTVTSSPGISVVEEGRSERWIVDLGGVLVAALSPETAADDGLLLLVRPPRQADGARRLLRLRLEPEPRLDLLAEGLGGWIDSLAAIGADSGMQGDPAGGSAIELVAGGPGRVAALGSLAALAARSGLGGAEPLAERPLFELAGFDLRALAADLLRRGVDRRFVAIEPGRLRFGDAAGAWSSEARLPLAVARTAKGLLLSSPPVAAVRSAAGNLYLAGPEALGSTRLRCFEIAAGEAGTAASPPVELWAALPGPEKVMQSWPFEIDGVPVLVVRTQAADELNLFERQRLRVLTLSADRTRSGAPPTLAVELDSKRWHETAIALGDVDGDGHDDLLAAFPEGLSGTDLVVQWWRGEGGGRFASRAHRSDLKKAPSGWELVATPDLPGGAGLFLVGRGRMELRAFSATGKGAVAERASLIVSIPALPVSAAPKAGKKVTIAVGGDGESAKVENIHPEAESLGAV